MEVEHCNLRTNLRHVTPQSGSLNMHGEIPYSGDDSVGHVVHVATSTPFCTKRSLPKLSTFHRHSRQTTCKDDQTQLATFS